MSPDFKYTKQQTLRGAKPDAEVGNVLYLIKNVSEMRLTYQIRMLAYLAHEKGRKLTIRLPRKSTLHASLREFIEGSAGLVNVERT